MRPNDFLERPSILPHLLDDKELVRYAQRYIDTVGLPFAFQEELLKRFETLVH